MRIKRLLMSVCLVASVSGLFAQLRYPVVGDYKNNSIQGMAIYNDIAYLFNNTGICRAYDLQKHEVVGEFLLGSAGEHNHANVACFGCEIPEGGTIPAIYITQCNAPYYCYVENVQKDTAMLVQTIRVEIEKDTLSVCAWTVDTEDQCLYSITLMHEYLDSLGSRANVIRKFRLPKLDEGKDIIFTEKDILDEFPIVMPNCPQGAKVKDGYIYFVTGIGQGWASHKDSQRSLKIIDPKAKRIVRDIDLTYLTTNEPEDIDFYNGMALINCGQQGGLWEVQLE